MGWLKNKGFLQIGSGFFSVAYAHPRYKRIVKISTQQDSCWLQFAHWTLKMTSHPNVPYIDWVRRYGDDDRFFIAVVEKLAPFDRTAIMNTIDLSGLAYLYLNDEDFENNEDIFDRLVKDGVIDTDFPTRKGIHYKIRAWLKTTRGGKRFINVVKSSKKFAKGNCDYDLHEQNIMYRPSDRHLVIIDPLADMGTW